MQPCCASLENRQPQPIDPARPDVAVAVCRVCGRRHITLEADPGQLGLTLK